MPRKTCGSPIGRSCAPSPSRCSRRRSGWPVERIRKIDAEVVADADRRHAEARLRRARSAAKGTHGRASSSAAELRRPARRAGDEPGAGAERAPDRAGLRRHARPARREVGSRWVRASVDAQDSSFGSSATPARSSGRSRNPPRRRTLRPLDGQDVPGHDRGHRCLPEPRTARSLWRLRGFLGGFGLACRYPRRLLRDVTRRRRWPRKRTRLSSRRAASPASPQSTSTRSRESLLNLSGVDDELIANAENLLLTLHEHPQRRRRGQRHLRPGDTATLDLSVCFGTDLACFGDHWSARR